MAAKKRGRPITTGRTEQVKINLSPAEKAALEAARARDGAESIPEWLREIGLEAARAT